MATYNIYGTPNENDDSPEVTVVLSDDDSEILDVIIRRPSDEDDTEDVLKDYMDRGATAIEALKLYTNSYGYLEKVTSSETSASSNGDQSE
jgi:hypothetical protein